MPDGELRETIQATLVRSEERFLGRIAAAWEHLCQLLGFRLRPDFHGDESHFAYPGRAADDHLVDATSFLEQLGASRIDHPGGTLLAHLGRVRTLLAEWGARSALRLAGLCHATYGTDGFPHPLLPIERRAELAEVIGAEAEALVYRYASCARAASYPRLPDGEFVDRFTGESLTPTSAERRDFAELTAANELDIVRVSAEFRTQHGPAIRGLLIRLRPLLSDQAWQATERLLPHNDLP